MEIGLREKYKPLNIKIPKNQNVSIFLYGRTNSGKTFTFDEILRLYPDTISVQISEIYNDVFKILLHETTITSQDEIGKIIKEKRKTKKTSQNNTSSRSILILTLKLAKGLKVRLIDLMGSEKAGDDIGKKNNQHLNFLRICMDKLKLKDKHIPYRNCSLTMLLQECITDSKVIFIGCIDSADEKETKRTLDFLEITKSIELPERVQCENKDDYTSDLVDVLSMLEKLMKD